MKEEQQESFFLKILKTLPTPTGTAGLLPLRAFKQCTVLVFGIAAAKQLIIKLYSCSLQQIVNLHSTKKKKKKKESDVFS